MPRILAAIQNGVHQRITGRINRRQRLAGRINARQRLARQNPSDAGYRYDDIGANESQERYQNDKFDFDVESAGRLRRSRPPGKGERGGPTRGHCEGGFGRGAGGDGHDYYGGQSPMREWGTETETTSEAAVRALPTSFRLQLSAELCNKFEF